MANEGLLEYVEVLDRLAAGETGRAADLLAQRFKAIELSLHASDPHGAAPTQRAALDFSRRRDAGGEGATRRDSGQALPPGGRDQQPGPRQRARTRQRGTPTRSLERLFFGENEERSENGAGKRRGRK